MIRPIQTTDGPDLIAMARETGFFVPREIDLLRGDLADPDPVDHHLIDDRGGFITFGPDPIGDRLWAVYWIVTARSAQGQGIGSALTAFAEQVARNAGGRLMYLETSATPQYGPTQRFYRGRRYDVIARVPDFYEDGHDKLIFGKRL